MNSSNNKNNKNISKKELFDKLSKINVSELKKWNISPNEIAYLKNKILNDKLGLVLNFEEKDENLENYYFGLEEVKELHINPKEKNNHLLIEGDNYYALKALQISGIKVDVIYIDPPYNTGNKDFIYNDNYVNKDDQFKHSKWLSFMKKRLELAKELLADDGVIFVSIDDNEQAYLKVLMDEIFGEDNFVGSWPRLKSTQGKNDSNSPISKHDFVVIFSKEIRNVEWNKKNTDNDYFTYNDNDGRGPYHLKNYISATEGLGYVKSLDFEIEINKIKYYPISKGKRTRWLWSKERIDKAIKLNLLVPKGDLIYSKKYLNYIFNEDNELVENVSKTHFDSLNILGKDFSNKQGTKELESILNSKLFSFPKPVSLCKFLINLINKNSIVLDFFAGSGTTAQAVMELNEEDGGNRRFILCTNNENDIAQKICRERIYRVINGEGSKKEEIDWNFSKDKKSLINNSMKYLKVKSIDKVNGDYEEINNLKEIYKNEFNKDLSIKDFK